MSEDWIDEAIGLLPHLPGVGGLGVALWAFFRGGRAVGRAEGDIEALTKRIDDVEAGAAEWADVDARAATFRQGLVELQERVAAVERTSTALAVKLAAAPTRDELRAMFAEARQDWHATLADLRADLRAALGRAG